MNYREAIMILNHIDDGTHTKEEIMAAIERILTMEMVSAISKETLRNTIRWLVKGGKEHGKNGG